ncbi:MAG: hypothetical protein JWR69_2965 [Pedosphaera sp.]|nr:hypothetical protein [Pedosphaera sp.]
MPTEPATTSPKNALKWTVIVAVNNQEVLRSSLLSSPEISSASEVILQTGFTSAAAAYNAGIEKARTDLLVFVHQDVYLPAGWVAALEKALDVLSKQDPQWGVLGVWGVKRSGDGVGYLYCAGLMQKLGREFEDAPEVRSLDEVLLIVRKSSGLRFDEEMPGFHMYGTDLCLEAQRRGMKCHAISAFCVHNTNGYKMLPLDFWQCYFRMRRKWKAELPVTTSCAEITFWCWPMVNWNLRRGVNLLLKRHKPGKRVPDPSRLYRERLCCEPDGVTAPVAEKH